MRRLRFRGPVWSGTVGGDFPVYGNVWNPLGTVMDATETDEQLQIQEPNVIYEAGAQVIATANPVFKMWYSGGYASSHIWYAESLDGINWVKRGIVVSDHTRGHVFKNGATYIMYAIGPGGLNKLTSADGITWAVANTGVLTTGGAGTWDSNAINNICVWVEGGTWYMLYEGDDATHYQIGLATSADSGATFTKSASNPVIASTGSVSGPFCVKIGAAYYCWCHYAASGMLPTDIVKYHSSDLVHWTQFPSGLAIPRGTKDEGVGAAGGQLADIFIVEVSGKCYAFYDAMQNGDQATGHLNSAVANMSLANLARSKEGVVSSYYPEMLQNPGFERAGAGGADVFAYWSETAGDGTLTKTTTAGEFHNGTGAIKLVAGAAKNTRASQAVTLPAGTYRFSGWARGDGTNGGWLRVYTDNEGDKLTGAPVPNATTTWTYFQYDFVAPASGGTGIYVYCPDAAGGVAFFDDLSLKRIA